MAKSNRTLHSAVPAPIGPFKCCIAYLHEGKERFSPWFYNREHASRALAILSAKFGQAVLVRD